MQCVGSGRLVSVRPSTVTFIFVVSFALLAILSRAISLNTSQPWFSSAESQIVYSATLLGGPIALFLSCSLTARRLDRIDEWIDFVAARRSNLRSAAADGPRAERALVSVAVLPPGMTVGIGQTPFDEPTGSEVGTGSLDPESGTHPSAPARAGSVRPQEMAEVSRLLLVQRRSILVSHLGPIAVALTFVGLAGMMLPGVSGFTVMVFRLNTMLVLLLVCGWFLFLGWLGSLSLAFPQLPHPRHER